MENGKCIILSDIHWDIQTMSDSYLTKLYALGEKSEEDFFFAKFARIKNYSKYPPSTSITAPKRQRSAYRHKIYAVSGPILFYADFSAHFNELFDSTNDLRRPH